MPNPVKQVVTNIPKTFGEAVVKPAVDETVNIVNEIPNSIFGYPSQSAPKDPQAEAKKKDEDEKKRQNILRYFEALKANAASYKQQQDFLAQQKKQVEIEEKQKVRQFDIQAKQKSDESVFRAQRKAEIKVKGG